MLSPFEIRDHPAGGIVSRGTGTAEVQVCNGGSILGRFGMRAQAEKLVQAVAPVDNNSAICHDRCIANSKSAVSILVSKIKSLQTPPAVVDL